jgi:hypothetical protein
MVTARVEKLLQNIDEAFSSVPTPTSDNLVYDNSEYNLECKRIKEKFNGTHWRDLSIADLQGQSAALSFFSPDAFRFFLPAFLRVSILDYQRSDVIPDSIVSDLSPPKDESLCSYWAERISPLSDMQKQVLREFIIFLRDEHGEDFFSGELDRAEKALV